MENFNFEQNDQERIEEQTKFEKFSGIIRRVYESINNSDDADEVFFEIDKFKKFLEQQNPDIKPERDYFLWTLFSPGSSSERSDYAYFDTEDDQIESFVKQLALERGIAIEGLDIAA